ncbi:hypothetical protein [Sphaerotilus sp.]|uniref:hypothetical protein n=1 Tax=Sphaerotilus sp. TaxID=2093942 RepID=UPI0025DC0058|nr:hypothetical protein [Sphaerotilus sp.]
MRAARQGREKAAASWRGYCAKSAGLQNPCHWCAVTVQSYTSSVDQRQPKARNRALLGQQRRRCGSALSLSGWHPGQQWRTVAQPWFTVGTGVKSLILQGVGESPSDGIERAPFAVGMIQNERASSPTWCALKAVRKISDTPYSVKPRFFVGVERARKISGTFDTHEDPGHWMNVQHQHDNAGTTSTGTPDARLLPDPGPGLHRPPPRGTGCRACGR